MEELSVTLLWVGAKSMARPYCWKVWGDVCVVAAKPAWIRRTVPLCLLIWYLYFSIFAFCPSAFAHCLPAPVSTFSTSAFSSSSFHTSCFPSDLRLVLLTPTPDACNWAQVSQILKTDCVHPNIASPHQAWESSRRVSWCPSKDVTVTLLRT